MAAMPSSVDPGPVGSARYSIPPSPGPSATGMTGATANLKIMHLKRSFSGHERARRGH